MTDLIQGLSPWVEDALAQVKSGDPDLKDASLIGAIRLTGGAVNQNFLLRLQSPRRGVFQWVMRRGQAQPVPGAHSRETEFNLFRLARDLGLTVPIPLALVSRDGLVASFFQWCPGQAEGRALVNLLKDKPDQVRMITEDLGRELGRLHRPGSTQRAKSVLQDTLGAPPNDSVMASLAFMQASFKRLRNPSPYMDFAASAVFRDRPKRQVTRPASLCHNDFRMGNVMVLLPSEAEESSAFQGVRPSGLSAVLDWEFASWGDPMADVGWITAACWRFGGLHPVAGIGQIDDFLRGYAQENDEPLPMHELDFWQRFAHLRWAIIAAQQGERVVSGEPESVELMITGAMAASIVQPVVEHYLGYPVHLPEFAPIDPSIKPVDDWLYETTRHLKEHLAPELKGAAKYSALMSANAVRLARARMRRPLHKGPNDAIYESLATALGVWHFKG